MIKIANILPNNCINEDMPRQSVEMYLTHKVLEEPQKYTFLKNDTFTYKILDNSACELGEGLDFNQVLKAAEIIGANEVVLPDIPRSGQSLSKTLQYLKDFQNVPYKLAAVVQGTTEEEVLLCAQQILMLKRVNTIMIPKWYCTLNSSNGLGRHKITTEIIKYMQIMGNFKEIHWLGLDTGIRELISPVCMHVRSVDTGYFTALATSDWSHLDVTSERPRELRINLQSMDVDLIRLHKLIDQQKQILEGEI